MRKFWASILAVLLVLSHCATGWAATSTDLTVRTPKQLSETPEAPAAPNASSDTSSVQGEGALEENGVPQVVMAEIVTKGGTLNMRKKDNKSSAVVAKLPSGAMVEVLEQGEKWCQVSYTEKNGKERIGYVMTEYLAFVEPVAAEAGESGAAGAAPAGEGEFKLGDRGPEIKKLKKRLQALGYFNDKAVNDRFDEPTEKVMIRFELVNGLPHSTVATAELQAFIYSDKAQKAKTGNMATDIDPKSGLAATIMGWHSSFRPATETTLNCSVYYLTNVSGGTEPYTITVTRSYDYNGAGGKTAESPFTGVWSFGTAAVFLTLTVEDAEGNSVSARARVGFVAAGCEWPTGFDQYGQK